MNNILIGDAAKSVTFVWSVFLITLLNVFHCALLGMGNKKARLTKFVIRINIEYGKIFAGLFLTTSLFFLQAIVVEHKNISSLWAEGKSTVIIGFATILLAFIIFPMIMVVINYFIVKYFRRALWKQE